MAIRTSRRQLALAAGVLGLAFLTVFVGREGFLNDAAAQPPKKKLAESPQPVPAPPTDYSKRVVAYIFDTIPITREELGEYLIARLGADRLTNLVNKRIIEHVCKQKGIEVTVAEVEAGLQEDLAGLNVSREEFVSHVLKKYKKTLYEWKEDVIKPRLLMTKLCRDRVKVTEEDLNKAFDAYYGEKVGCRIILWPEGEHHIAMQAYAKIRDSEEEFDRAARKQASANLAASGGRIEPVGRNTTGNPDLEKALFALQPGEITAVIRTPEGFVVAKCDKRIPPDQTKKLADVRAKLEKEVFDKKVQAEIPAVFKEMQQLANAKSILKGSTTEDELIREVQQELRSDARKPATTPGGN